MTKKRKAKPAAARITLGPVLFNWAPEQWRDYHFRIADEAPVDTVHVGEIVCSKRAPFLAEHLPAVIERLAAAGKEVVLASPALVTNERERQSVVELGGMAGMLVEANDVGALRVLSGKPHVVGPLVNVYNEATLDWMADRGAVRFCLPGELAREAIAAIAGRGSARGVGMEVIAFGRLPLAISARCYHARSHGLHKDGCQFVCGQDDDGMTVTTLDGEPFLAVNGTQTLSYTYHCLAAELADLRAAGVTRFRLSPHSFDMVAVARLYRDLLDGAVDAAAALERLRPLVGAAGLSNGFYQGREGAAFIGAGA